MCGLSAIVDFGPAQSLAGRLLAMHARIPHRGPDGEGFCLLDASHAVHAPENAARLQAVAAERGARAALAFRWLQIQDRNPASSQPMASHDGSVRLAFNGEIYNFRALRDELAALGHRFSTASDTEVVLAAYREWGAGMFGHMDGMWALVLLDVARGKLLASRDRFGIKPLYYHQDGERVLLASEVKQLLAAGVTAAANVGAVARFVRGARPESTGETYFGQVAAQPAGTYCEIDLAGPPRKLAFQSYWQPPEPGTSGATLEEATDNLDRLLAAAVDEHMAAAVPVGILASGGLDSSLVAALSVRAFATRREKPVAFSMVLATGEPLDESPWISRLTSHLSFDAATITLGPEVLRDRMPALAWAQEEPVAGIAVAGQYLTHELAASRGVRVVLDGQGSDELFGGYPRHQFAYLADRARHGAWGTVLAESAALAFRDPRFFATALAGRLASGRVARAATFLRASPGNADPLPATLGETLRRDVLHGNLRWVLGVTDRNAMAHSIEARVPYVSQRVAEFAFGLPDRFRVGAGERKRLLRRVAARHLPRALVKRRNRVGFGAPGARWLREAFAPDLRALPRSETYATGTLVDPLAMGDYIKAFLAGAHEDAGTIWRLYAVERWACAYSVTGL